MSASQATFRPRRHKIVVVSQTNLQGEVIPLRFTWRGATYDITSWGRRWTAADGEHSLVMSKSGRMFELVYRPQDGDWFLVGASPSHTAV